MANGFLSARLTTQELQPFEGAWKMAGHAYDSPFGPEAAVSGYETFEWLAGEHFLVHHLEGRLGDGELACVEILGPDSNGEAFEAHTFYSDGTSNVWRLGRTGSGWAMTGEWPTDGEVFDVRCTITFESRARRRATWEYSTDGSAWRIFWQTRAERLS